MYLLYLFNNLNWGISSLQRFHHHFRSYAKIVSEYDQEIPQSQTADNPVAPQGRAAQPSRDTRKQIKKSNQLSLPHQDDCNARMDTK